MRSFSELSGISLKFAKEIYFLLSKRQRLTVALTLALRFGLVVLDLLGIVLIGAVVSLLSGTTISKSSAFGSVLSWLEMQGITNGYAVILTVAVFFFILKGATSVLLNSITARYVSKIEVQISARAFSNLVESNIEVQESITSQLAIFSVTQSVSSATTKAVMVASSILSEIVLLATISIYLASVDLFLFLSVATFFAFVGWVLNRFVSKAAGKKAALMHETDLATQGLVLDTLRGIRQISNSANRHTIKERFNETRQSFATLGADYQVITSLPRYVTEIAVMLGVGILVLQRSLGGPESAPPGVIAMFLAGIFRIVSSMIPLQSALTNWRSVEFEAEPVLQSLKEFDSSNRQEDETSVSAQNTNGLLIQGLTYTFPNSGKAIVDDVSLHVEQGSFIAIVGDSGSGKSTFVDLLLGLRVPTLGGVYVAGVETRKFLRDNPNYLGYVPQQTTVLHGTIRENISLNFSKPYESEVERVHRTLEAVGLSYLLVNLTDGIETSLGSGKSMLSGGEIQRLGLARALFVEPKILVLDEATSALDDGSQKVILDLLRELKGKLTIIVIAHRLETLENADDFYRMSNGKLHKVAYGELFE